LLVACAAPRGAPARAPEPPVAKPAPDPLVAFFTARRAEIDERLTLPTQQYLAHDQPKPKGFADYSRRRSVVGRVHSARMFAYQFSGSCEDRIVGKDGRICDDAVYPGAQLTPEQTKRAVDLLHDASLPASWSKRASIRCFEPHHALVFFDERGVPVADIAVCFECGNFKLAPGPEDERSMTDEEVAFFADTCRAQGVGGCPPDGASRMPDRPAEAGPQLSYEEYVVEDRKRMLARDVGVRADALLTDLQPLERKLTCAWLGRGSRGLTGWECQDGRAFVLDDAETCRKPVAKCDATVGDLVECARSRIVELCGAESPRCAKSDACQRGVVKRVSR
jgi:hypothetical protein